MYILGIDVGSSFLKSSILDLEGFCIRDTHSTPTPAFLEPASERKEIPMKTLADAVARLIDRAAEAFPLGGIVFSVQMHGFVLFDQEDGSTGNYVSWQDMRGMVPDETGETLLERLRRQIPAHLLAENGINLKQNHSLLPLYHYLNETPLSHPVQLAMLGDGLTRILTGQRVPIHPTVAASSGLYSLKKQAWNSELIAFLGMQQIDFPPVVEEKGPVAFYPSKKGDIPIYTALGDHQAAVLGTYASDGDMFINIGTGGQVGYVDDGIAFGNFETRPFFQGRTIRAFTQLPSGRSLNVLMRFIMDVGRELFGCTEVGEREIWRKVDALTEDLEAGADGLHMDFSFFDSDGGSISGISGENFTTQNLFYSVYDSMAAAYYRQSKLLLTPVDSAPAGVVCTGGVVRKNPLLLRCIERQFNLPCRLAPCSDDTMIGLMRYALWCRDSEPLFGGAVARNLSTW
ncbi:MAG: hypothetical protein HFG20_02065 [Anaerotruncus sp.]|nr:hypothetical protein [Anaerotruncus sp.]